MIRELTRDIQESPFTQKGNDRLLEIANSLIPEFKWKTMDNKCLTVDQMDTKHIFNSMKMYYNHIAEQIGKDTIWFNNKYSDGITYCAYFPEEAAKKVAFFVCHIEFRGDLPHFYHEVYKQIINSILGTRLLNEKNVGLLQAGFNGNN